jgi:hypothetical protein
LSVERTQVASITATLNTIYVINAYQHDATNCNIITTSFIVEKKELPYEMAPDERQG